MHHRRLLQQQSEDARRPGNDVSPSLLITVLILAIAVILSASLYLLLRFLRRGTTSSAAAVRTASRSLSSTSVLPPRHVSSRVSPLIEALPLFTSDSLKSTGGGDCAVCLSKFEKKDLLRLLPLCCHVFHVECIDTWLNSNQSCPLCRSPVFLPDHDLISKLVDNSNNNNNDVTASSSLPHSLSSSSRSFRVEIGSVSRRNTTTNSGEIHGGRSYSLGGNFDYVVEDDVVSEVHSGSFRSNSNNNISDFFKADSDNNQQQQQQQQQLASEVGTRGGGWLKDYLTHSLSSSFRSSGRWFFTGSSRREMTAPGANDLEMSEMDMEASRLGDEIGELFRWLSGV